MASWAGRIVATSRSRLGLSKTVYQGCSRSKMGHSFGWRFASTEMTDRVMSDDPVVVASTRRDINIPENIGLAEHVLTACSKFGNRVAMVDGVTGAETTFGQLTTKITRVASAFVKAGLRKGDVVTIFSPNCPEFAITYLAVAAMGGVVSAVNPVYTAGELMHTMEHAGTKFLITAPVLIPVAKQAAKQCPALKGIIVFGEADGCRPYSNLIEDDGSAFPENLDFNPKEDLVALPYSSGTTGLPKGVMLTHYNLISNIEQIRTEEILGYTGQDTLIGILPFFHIYGQTVVMLTGFVGGVKTVTVPKFDPEHYLECIQNYRVTFMHLVPPIALFLAQNPMVAKYDLKSLSGIMCAAAPIGAHVFDQLLDKVVGQRAFRVAQGYGLTECSPVSHCNPPSGFKYASIGPPVHNTESKVVDVSDGKTLGYGHEGEVWLRGPQVMKGYFKNQKATDETVDEEGWLHTGDIGYCQPDGHFYITDRLKELIKVKGLQVAPAELEAILLQHPCVQDSAVIGIPDERAGELPRAYIVLKASSTSNEDDILHFVNERVAPFKQLAGGVEFTREIPKSASGKILRRVLRDAHKQK